VIPVEYWEVCKRCSQQYRDHIIIDVRQPSRDGGVDFVQNVILCPDQWKTWERDEDAV
jgi:hypothetical protein